MPDRSVSWPYDIRKHFSLWRYFGRSLGRTCWFWSHGVENFLGCFGMYSLLGFGEGYPSAVLTCLSVDAVRGIHTNIINIERASFNGFPPCYWIIWIMNLNPKSIKKHLNHFQPLWTSCSGCHKARLCQRSLPSCRGHAERNPVWCHGWLMRRALPQRSDIPIHSQHPRHPRHHRVHSMYYIYESIRGKGWIYEDLRQLMFDIVWMIYERFVCWFSRSVVDPSLCHLCPLPGSRVWHSAGSHQQRLPCRWPETWRTVKSYDVIRCNTM